MSASGPWPHDPRGVAASVLSDPRFRVRLPVAGKSWWDYLLDALRPWWHRLFDPLWRATGNARATNVIGTIVLVAVALFLVVVVVRFARGLRFRRKARERAAVAALADGAGAQALFERALAAMSAGRYHDAAGLLWASGLRALDERGRVRYDAARTPGEWRRAVGDPAFDAFARDAVVALFGDRPPDADLVARMRASYDRIVAPA
ncbi:MAG TPA: DUF4129 domain-containing protein [Candidatus Elarobacter sp.]|jgi:hypothetical protein|nr:DUF4129 domain-containing protein [Candidatus Elarobacter sp.]